MTAGAKNRAISITHYSYIYLPRSDVTLYRGAGKLRGLNVLGGRSIGMERRQG